MEPAVCSSTATTTDSAASEYRGLKDEQEKNTKKICCPRCPSELLLPERATFTEKNQELPNFTMPKGGDCETTLHRYFWFVKDKLDFENAGFTNQSGTSKFVTCADCEIGPLGYLDLDTGHCYVSVDLVAYK